MKSEFENEGRRQMEAVEELQAGNNRIKLMLVQMLKGAMSADAVRSMDDFHSMLLDKDTALAIIRHDIAQLLRYIHGMSATDQEGEQLVRERLLELSSDIRLMIEETEALLLLLERQKVASGNPAVVNSAFSATSFHPE